MTQNLERLLAIPNSELARLLRFQLRGTRAALEAALAESHADPGSAAAQDALRDIDRLLGSGTGDRPRMGTGPVAIPTNKRPETLPYSHSHASASHTSASHASPSPRDSASGQKSGTGPMPAVPRAASSTNPGIPMLEKLRKEIEADPRLREEIGVIRLMARPGADGELWEEVQRLLLRASRPAAKQWRDRAAEIAREVGAQPDESPQASRAIPGDREESIYPGLTGSVQATGLRFSPAAPLDPAVREAVGSAPLDGDFRSMARAASASLVMAREWPGMHHALRTLQRFRVVPLDATSREAWERELLARLRRLLAVRPDPVLVLRAWIDFDEATHSLVFLPPSERDSWRGRWLRDIRRALERAADVARASGANVHLRSLWGPYSEVCDSTESDLELDAGGNPGQVLTCLRVYARINAETIEGRVLYRSLR